MNYINYTGDPRATLCHFNPNHDPRNGQFASGSGNGRRVVDKLNGMHYNIDEKKLALIVGIGSAAIIGALGVYGGYNLYQSGMLDAHISAGKRAIDELKDKVGDKSTPRINQKSPVITELEGHIKKLANPETITESMQHANPNFGNPSYRNNCVSCALATFLRRMGFDAKARSYGGVGQKTNEIIERCFNITKDGSLWGRATAFSESPDVAAKMLRDKFGDNASGVVAVQFKGRGKIPDVFSGHAFNWQIFNGKVEFFDGQNANGIRTDWWCRSFIWPRIHAGSPFMAYRLDNATPVVDEILKNIEL